MNCKRSKLHCNDNNNKGCRRVGEEGRRGERERGRTVPVALESYAHTYDQYIEKRRL